jgi:hypothetical protein
MDLPAHSDPRPLVQFRNHFSQTVGLLGRVMSPSQSRYLYTGQHKQNKSIYTPNIYALSGIGTQDPSIRAIEDNLCLIPRGYYDRLHPVPGGCKYGDLALQVGGGSLESETVKYGHESLRLGPENALAMTNSNCKRHTHRIIREDVT